MQVTATWTGAQADALRQALRMTNESFAEHLGVSVRTVAYWRQRPDMIPQRQIQDFLNAALDRASDRIKAQFALLASETRDGPEDEPDARQPFCVPLDAMTNRGWNGDDARRLSLSFDAALERSAVEDIERLSHLWLISDPPQVIELSAGRPSQRCAPERSGASSCPVAAGRRFHNRCCQQGSHAGRVDGNRSPSVRGNSHG
jgi:hypothetical protein